MEATCASWASSTLSRGAAAAKVAPAVAAAQADKQAEQIDIAEADYRKLTTLDTVVAYLGQKRV